MTPQQLELILEIVRDYRGCNLEVAQYILELEEKLCNLEVPQYILELEERLCELLH